MHKKCVLVTGGEGFIGKYTVQELLNNNFDVIIADRKKESQNTKAKYYRLDVATDELSKVFENIRGIKVESQIIPVKFKLIRGTKNRIQAVDVEISGVSLVIEYRKRFYEMIKEDGEDIDWFLQRFNDQVVANENVAYRNLLGQ